MALAFEWREEINERYDNQKFITARRSGGYVVVDGGGACAGADGRLTPTRHDAAGSFTFNRMPSRCDSWSHFLLCPPACEPFGFRSGHSDSEGIGQSAVLGRAGGQ